MGDVRDLPREWMLAGISASSAKRDDLLRYIQQAQAWGFVPDRWLTTNDERRAWLKECREAAWDRVHAAERRDQQIRDRCTITAAEVNEMLRGFPDPSYG